MTSHQIVKKDTFMSSSRSPILVVDFKYNMMRIHRSTLSALQYPDYFDLIVSPTQKKIGIRALEKQTPDSVKVNLASLMLQRSIELYSTNLIRNLLDINPQWEDEKIYKMEGVLIPSEKIVLFDGLCSEPIHSEEYAAAQ